MCPQGCKRRLEIVPSRNNACPRIPLSSQISSALKDESAPSLWAAHNLAECYTVPDICPPYNLAVRTAHIACNSNPPRMDTRFRSISSDPPPVHLVQASLAGQTRHATGTIICDRSLCHHLVQPGAATAAVPHTLVARAAIYCLVQR